MRIFDFDETISKALKDIRYTGLRFSNKDSSDFACRNISKYGAEYNVPGNVRIRTPIAVSGVLFDADAVSGVLLDADISLVYFHMLCFLLYESYTGTINYERYCK